MEKELNISEELSENVKSIQISEETKTLLYFRARLSEVYNNVTEIYSNKFCIEGDKSFDEFSDIHAQLDKKLMEIISLFIDYNSMESNYTQM